MNSLGDLPGFDRNAFEKVHESGGQVTSIRINPKKKFEFRNPNFEISSVPWSQFGYYLSKRPSFTFDPLFHAGCYYVQEASSMFLEQALQQTADLSQALRILDLAAAPGGKSTHIQSLISADSLLVSNEVIRNRCHILKDNTVRWGSGNVVVTNNDPTAFSNLENYFDVVVVDAPCSGSGLFRRDEEAIGEWSEKNVQLCSQRQQRILVDVLPALKKDGVLIYSTCSYSREEDEHIIEWMMKEFEMKNEKLKIEKDWNITESSAGYRFWPDKVKGEGFFIACLRKSKDDDLIHIKTHKKFQQANKKQEEIVKKWIKETNLPLVQYNNSIHAVSQKLGTDINLLSARLNIAYFGTRVGEVMADKLIPDHALAMSPIISDRIDKVELTYEQAISFLKRNDIKDISAGVGWKLVVFQNHALGWVNVLPNRINNYYPKELRILKDI